ncbi:MAG: protein kinase [Myxococcota bacterium]
MTGREIGRGATAVVVLGAGPRNEQVAIKIRPRGIPASDRRFLREFESMRALRLPGVVRVIEAGLHRDYVWFSMEFVDGQSFLERAESIGDPRSRVDQVLDQSCQLLDVLHRLHSAGLVHRDIKPSNVLVDQRGRVQLLDFGIGRFFEQAHPDHSEGQGTLPYMAPEQLAGLASDHTVDLFATGLMMHEALVGSRPPTSNPLGWVTRTCLHRLPALASVSKAVPRRLSHIVDGLLHVDPQARPTAAQAGAELRLVRGTPDSHDWPEPRFVDPGLWWETLQDRLEVRDEPLLAVLHGPSGSGRTRLAEQLQRHALLEGVRTIHIHGDVTSVGGPLLQALTHVLGGFDDEGRLKRLVAGSGGALRQMWPQLPAPPGDPDDPVPTMTRVAEAAAETLARAAAERDLLIVFHRLEQVDLLTSRALRRLAQLAEPALGLVLMHESRWSTALSERVVHQLRTESNALYLRVPKPDASVAEAICKTLLPADASGPQAPASSTPQRTVELANASLARWRGEPWLPPGAELWPLAAYEPLPAAVLVELVGTRALDSQWVEQTPAGVRLAGCTAQRAARNRLADQATAARAVAEAWVRVQGDRADAGALARLHLLAGQPDEARAPARTAALRELQQGRYSHARRWLFLLDALPAKSGRDHSFELAAARAKVALVTEAEAPRTLLVEVVERAATTPAQVAEATLLRAAYQLRQGEVRPALVECLRLASPSRAPTPAHAAHALVLATHCRLRLHQLDDAQAQLTRAEALLAGADEVTLSVEVALMRAQLLLQAQALDAAGAQAEALVQDARRRHHLHDEARASGLLAQVLRRAGRRSRAEALARSARTRAAQTGDLALVAEVTLTLATLQVERGDATAARSNVDGVLRQLQELRLDHLIPHALRVVLQIAQASGDPHAADLALSTFRTRPHADPEAPATLVRWWRLRGDVQRALSVPAPTGHTWGNLIFRLERARVYLVTGQQKDAEMLAREARIEASENGFDELELYAQLLEHAATEPDVATWNQTCSRALESVWTELCFGALELDARRRGRDGDTVGATDRWRTLLARCEELGYRPGSEEAQGWLDGR